MIFNITISIRVLFCEISDLISFIKAPGKLGPEG